MKAIKELTIAEVLGYPTKHKFYEVMDGLILRCKFCKLEMTRHHMRLTSAERLQEINDETCPALAQQEGT